MKLQARQHVPDAAWLEVLAQGEAISAVVDGEIIACGGVVRSIGFVWAAFSQAAGRHFLALHRLAHRFIEQANISQLEAVTEADFPQGHRWLGLLGFRCKGYLPNDGLNGEDHYQYARLN